MEVAPGEVYGLIGPNGAGKTTTLAILATLLRPDGGSVTINGHALSTNPMAIRRVIGYVPDYAGVYPDTQVEEYLHFFAALHGVAGRRAEALLGDVLDLTDLTHKRDALVEGLSRGMQQRLSIARVLMHDPKVLLLDEPASGLDPRARVEMRGLLRELCAMGKTIVISSHILAELAELCTTVGVLQDGALLFQGNMADLLRKARPHRTVLLRFEPPSRPPAGNPPAESDPGDLSGEESGERGERDDPTDPPPPEHEVDFPGEEAPCPLCERARQSLVGDPRVEAATIEGQTVRVRLRPEASPAFLAPLLVAVGLPVVHLAEDLPTLEDAFMHLTGGGAAAQAES